MGLQELRARRSQVSAHMLQGSPGAVGAPRWTCSLRRHQGHYRLMAAPATVAMFWDERSSLYNTHLVTRPLEETHYPDDASLLSPSSLPREIEMGTCYNKAKLLALGLDRGKH